ncbi:MAG: S8 family serine peptidase [Phycisphaeraceae bacterium]
MTGQARSDAGAGQWSTILLVVIFAVAAVAATWSRSDAGGEASHARGSEKTSSQSLRSLVGIDRVERWLGEQTPTGRGITFGHVEGRADSGYLPRWNAGAFEGVKFTNRSRRPSRYSGHAEATAQLIYGPMGLAPGVTNVNLYSADEWMGSNGMRLFQAALPTADGCRVFTHSWISGNGPIDDILLKRLDQFVEDTKAVVVCGVNNGGNQPVPAMPASAYNVIAVGTVGRSSSSGYTGGTTPGRCKPEVVVDVTRTSFATPVVAAVVGRLLESADRIAAQSEQAAPGTAGRHAARPEVIKALLLAGADSSCGFAPEDGHSLDQHHGAGAVRFDRSLECLLKGPVAPGVAAAAPMKIAQPIGWDFRSLPPDRPAVYSFELTEPVKELSIAVTWHRRITWVIVMDPGTKKQVQSVKWRVADFDLHVKRTAGGKTSTIASSASTKDSVEFIRLRDVKEGVYHIEVMQKPMTREAWDVAVAWWSQK